MREPVVAAVMTADVTTIDPDTPFKNIAELLNTTGFSAVPVVDDAGRVLGVVSESDLLAKEEYRGGTAPPPSLFDRGHRRRKAWGLVASDLMSKPVISVSPDTPVNRAARTLARSDIRRLFVVDASDRLVGVVARHDLLKVFLRADDELRTEIKEKVIEGVLSLEPGSVEVEVSAGVVTLRGRLDRRSDTELAMRVTRAVSGVVAVDDQLTFVWDDVTVIL